MNRRTFIKALAAAGISTPALSGMASTEYANPRYLILIELQGGNDGLNTVIPFSDPLYTALRPTIGIKRDDVIQLDETTGLHPALSPLMRLWNKNEVAVIQGIGYPEPNRSHFRSIEIWETASESDETLLDGWLRPLTASIPHRQNNTIKALALANDQGPLAGATHDTVVFNDLNSFVKQAQLLTTHEPGPENKALQHLLTVENTARSAAHSFAKRLDNEHSKATDALPGNAPKLVKQLDLIARLIEGDAGPQVFKVELGSFDTHANQLSRHAALMKELSQGLSHIEKSLSRSGHWSNVLLMTYSEFGRRAAENGSAGTDHGTAAPHFMVGGSVKGGLYGKNAELGKLTDNDIVFDIDFRSLYSTVSRHWFQQASGDTPYADFTTLPVLRSG